MSSALRVLVVLLVAVLSTVSGCSGDDDDPGSLRADPTAKAPSEAPAKVLTKGTCWGDEQLPDVLGKATFDDWVEEYAGADAARGESMRDDAAFSNEIDCSEPHSIELYNVVGLRPPLARQVKEYADVLDQKSTLFRRIRDQVSERCLASSPYGKAQRRAGGINVQLSPWLSERGGLHVAWDPFPADLWAKGQRKFVCTFEQDRPGTLRFADLTTKKVPVASRVCLNTPRKYRSCAGKHQAEVIGEMTLNQAIKKGEVAGRSAVRKGPDGDYVALSDAQYAKLDKVCQTFLTMVSDVRGGVVGRAYPGAVSQWPTAAGDYVGSCFALKPYEPPPLISGTVFNRG